MPLKRWIDTVKERLRKIGLDFMQARIGVNGGGLEGECMLRSLGDEPLTLMRCHSYMKPLKVKGPSVAEPTT